MDKLPQNILPTTHATPSTNPPYTNWALHLQPQKYNLSQSIYTDGSFIPLDGKGSGNLAGSGVYSQLDNIQIAERLPRFQNILRVELYAIWLALANTQELNHDINIFTDSLNSIYLINNHVRRPSSQHNYPDKLLTTSICQHITWFRHKITIQKS